MKLYLQCVRILEMSQEIMVNDVKITNTVFSDEIESVSVQDRECDSTIVPTRSAMNDAMTDSQWNLKMMFKKPRVIKTVPFSISNTVGSTIALVQVINDLVGDLGSIQNNMIQSYTYFRGNPHFRFVVNATKFHIGRLMAVWVPLQAPVPQSVHQASGYQHCLIDMANNSPVEFSIPFFHKYGAVNMMSLNDDSGNLGFLYLIVLNPLLASTGVSATVDVTVFGWFDDVELRIPVDSALTRDFIPTKRNHRLYEQLEAQGIFDIFTDVFDTVSKTVNGVGSALDHAVNGDFGDMIDDIGDVLKSGSDFVEKHPEILEMCCDRPISARVELNSKRMCFSSFSYGIGSDTVSRLGLNPHGMHIPNASVLSGHVNDVLISKIVSTPMLMGTYPWAQANATGHVIFSSYVNPILLSNADSPSYLAYTSDFFEYYRGGIDMRLDLVASQFHSGRLLVAYIPGVENPSILSGLTLDEALISPNIILDLSNTENRSYTFTLPYVANRPWLRTHKGLGAPDTAYNYCSGYVVIFVLNALVSPDNVSNTISMNVYVAGANDFSLCYPISYSQTKAGLRFRFPDYPNSLPSVTSFEEKGVVKRMEKLQMQGLDTAVVGMENSMMLQLREAPLPVDQSHFFNEYSASLSDVIRRYGKAYNEFSISIGAVNTTQYVGWPVDAIGDRLLINSPLTYFARLFVGWSGSIRYKIFSDCGSLNSREIIVSFDPNNFISLPVSGTAPSGTALLQTEGPIAIKPCNGAYEPCVEFEIPYSSSYHFIENYNEQAWDDANKNLPYVQNGTLFVSIKNGLNPSTFQESTNFSVFTAAGDDFCFHYLIPPQPNTFNNNP
jgi:hypothetical protein